MDSSSKIEKIEVPGRKNQSFREFDGDHFYILDVEFGRKFFSLSNLTLRIFLIFHLCGQFIKKWKNLKFTEEKIKVVENLTGIISIYLTLNLEEKIFPLSHLTLRIFLTFHLCGQFIKNWKKLKFLDEKIKVVENLTVIISIYLTLTLKKKLLSHPTLRIFLIFHLCEDSSSKIE